MLALPDLIKRAIDDRAQAAMLIAKKLSAFIGPAWVFNGQ